MSRSQILVVDDDPGVARALSRALGRAGHDVTLVAGCEAATRLERQFDAAVLDLELPDGNGAELAGRLLAARIARTVVFFSASSDAALLARAREHGPVLSKLDPLESLTGTIAARIESYRSAETAKAEKTAIR